MNNWKVVPIKKTTVVDEDFNFTSKDTRYIIIDTETGEVLDDAQGYGYKTQQNAYKAWTYKNRTPEQKKRYNEIKNWVMSHKDLIKQFNNLCEIAISEYPFVDVTAKDVDNLLVELNLKDNCPYKPSEIIRILKKL